MTTTIVTGATSGIGLEISKQLAAHGHNLILISRSHNKLKDLREKLISVYSIDCEIYCIDLSICQSNLQTVEKIIKSKTVVDILINNVGAIFMNRILTPEGIEKTFALNHMSYFIMSSRLINHYDNLKIINVSSAAHRNIKLNTSDLQNRLNYSGWHAYKRSKLANIYLSYELHRRYSEKGHTINCLHPGVVNTNFANNNSFIYKIAASIIKYFGISSSEGAKTPVYLATNNDIADISGLYFDNCYPKKTSLISYDVSIAQKLWDYSEILLNDEYV